MVQRGLYQPLDVNRLENWDDIFPSMKELPGVMVDGQPYIVPVDAGTAGIMYDADVVTDVPDSWTDLFDPQYAGRASLEDLSVTAIDVGALANGITDPISMDETQLQMVKQFLIDHRGQFRTFWKGEADIKSQFKNGEVVISSGYPGTAKALRDEGVNVQFAPASEGQMLWTCGYGISPEAENLDAAYALLNWYTSLPPQIYAAENFSYVTSNSKIVDEVSQDVLDSTGISGFVTGEDGAPTDRQPHPGEPARGRGRVARGVDRGEGGLVARAVRAPAATRPAPDRPPRVTPADARDLVVACVPRVRVPRALRARRDPRRCSRSTTRPCSRSRSRAFTTRWFGEVFRDTLLREALANSVVIACDRRRWSAWCSARSPRSGSPGSGSAAAAVVGGLVGAPLVLPVADHRDRRADGLRRARRRALARHRDRDPGGLHVPAGHGDRRRRSCSGSSGSRRRRRSTWDARGSRCSAT